MLNQKGFTLLEVLLAITITAFIGVGATQLLSGIINTKTATESRSADFKVTQRADTWIKQDLWQIAGRQTHNSLGSKSEELSNQGDYLLEFTRSGLVSLPFSDTINSNLQRIAYEMKSLESDDCELARESLQSESQDTENDHYCFIRLILPELDDVQGLEPLKQILLDDILDVKFQFRGQIIDPNNPNNSLRSSDWQGSWPPLYIPNGAFADPAQIQMTLTLPKLGEVVRIYEVPRFAYHK